MKHAFLLILRIYRLVGSPWLGGACRFTPSCSSYAMEAISGHGALRGAGMTLCRILRCHPFYRGAYYDPVPPPRPHPRESTI